MATKTKTEVAGPMQSQYKGMPFTSKASDPKKPKSKMKKSTMRKR